MTQWACTFTECLGPAKIFKAFYTQKVETIHNTVTPGFCERHTSTVTILGKDTLMKGVRKCHLLE